MYKKNIEDLTEEDMVAIRNFGVAVKWGVVVCISTSALAALVKGNYLAGGFAVAALLLFWILLVITSWLLECLTKALESCRVYGEPEKLIRDVFRGEEDNPRDRKENKEK